MNDSRRPAEGKPSSHHRSGGGSKKSARRSLRGSSGAPGAGGDRATGSIDTRKASNGGVAVHPDSNTISGVAQGKDSGATPNSNENGRVSATGAKGSRRGNRGSRVRGEGEGGAGRSARQLEPAEHQNRASAVAGSSVDRAILERWKTEASAAVGERQAPTPNQVATPQDPPAEVDEEDEGGGGYDDEGFEEYSEEFEGDGDQGTTRSSASASASAAATATAPASRANARALESRVVSPALKVRQPDQVVAPDDKALQELRHSLREENDVAIERRVARPTTEASLAAEAKSTSSASVVRGAARGAKGAKGSKNTAPEARAGDDTVARGKFSLEASAHSEARSSRKRSSSSFKMADAKALGRALAKGDPRAERVRAVRAVSRLEMESVRLFDQPPVTPIDLYHRKLRGQPALIRQVASQTNDDARSVEAQTDEITCANKEVQFHLGHDDTALENLMRRLRSARRPPRGEEQKTGSSEGELRTGHDDDEEGTTITFKDVYRSAGGVVGSPSSLPSAAAAASIHGGQDKSSGHLATESNSTPASRLGRFLRQACVVMETLCEENVFAAGGARMCAGGHAADPAEGYEDNGDRSTSLFPEGGKGWEEVGGTSMASSLSNHSGSAANEGVASGLGNLIDGVDVVGVAFSRSKRSMLVTAHARVASKAHRPAGEGAVGGRRAALEGCGIVCVWNAESVTMAPVKVLFGEGLFSCLCLALHQPHVVLVGTAEGCVLLWDLREPAPSSRKEEATEVDLQCGLHPATYTTAAGGSAGAGAGMVDPEYGHTSGIVSVVAIPTPKEGGGDAMGMGGMLSLGESNSFQVASLDDRGTVSIWLVTETSLGDEGGSQTDLGLSPGGRVRLTLSKSFRPGMGGARHHLMGVGNKHSRVASHTIAPTPENATIDSSGATPTGGGGGSTGAVARALAFSPDDPNRFLLGTSSDRVSHASRLGNPPPPRAYRPPRRRSSAWGDFSRSPGRGASMVPGEELTEEGPKTGGVTCVNFSPFFHRFFLAGCGDGSVRLYKDDCAVPLTVWEGFSALPSATSGAHWPPGVSSVHWSEHRPAVFFVLDTVGTLHAFDLLEDDTGPVVSEACPPAQGTEGVFQGERGGRNGTAAGLESGIWEEKEGETREQPLSGATERKQSGGWGSSSAFSLPVLALSSETLATGSRPRVAVSARGRAFTRGLSRRMFGPPPRPSLETAVGGGREGKEGGEGDVIEETSRGERRRMEEWLGQILWA